MYLCCIVTVLQNDFKWLKRDKSKSSQFEIVAKSLTRLVSVVKIFREQKVLHGLLALNIEKIRR